MKRDIFLVLFLLLLNFFSPSLAEAKANYTHLEREIIAQLNKERSAHSLAALRNNNLLKRAAEMKLQDMIVKNYFAHTSPEGLDAWHWFQQVGYNYKFAGENLASNFHSAWQVHQAWMKSPKHRNNMLFPQYQEVAVAVGQDKNGELIVVELFGTRMPTNVLSNMETKIKAENNILSLQSALTKGKTSLVLSDKDYSGKEIDNFTDDKINKENNNDRIDNEEGNGWVAMIDQNPDDINKGYFKYFNNAVTLVIAILCFILLLDVWVLENEDRKVIDIVTACKASPYRTS